MASPGARTLFLTLLIFALPGTARATEDRPLDGWVTDRPVHAMQRSGDILYIGGDFSRVGPATGRGVSLDPVSGAPDLTWPKFDGTVTTAVPDGEGGLFVGGSFRRVDGVRRERVAHVGADGTLTSFSPSVNGSVRTLLLDGSTLYIGGLFTQVDGTTRRTLAAVDAASGAVLPWNADVTGTQVFDLAVSGSTLFVGGAFTQVGTSPRANLAAINRTTGVASSWNPGADSTSTPSSWRPPRRRSTSVAASTRSPAPRARASAR